jgi:hypothetical protein
MSFMLLPLILLAACAKSPDTIPPSYVSQIGYQSWSCRHLAEENQRLQAALTTASARQENARTNDIVGVVLIGLPVSSLSGDNIAPEIGRLKGEIDVTHKAFHAKGCTAASIAS